MSVEQRRQMAQSSAFSVIKPEHPSLSVVRQCELAPICQRPRTTVPNPAKPLGLRPEHRVWPYLLRGVVTDRPNQAWCTDLTDIPMRRGFLHLVAVMDWAARKVLSWRASNTVDPEFCIAALEGALARFGHPEIPAQCGALSRQLRPSEIAKRFARGSQFTSPRFTGVLQRAGVRISMDGRGRWMDCESIRCRPESLTLGME